MLYIALLPVLITVGAMMWISLAAYIPGALASRPGGIGGFLLRVTLAPVQLALQVGGKIIRAMTPPAVRYQQQVGVALHDAAGLVRETAGVVDAQSATVAQLAQALAGTATAADLAIERAKLGKRIGTAEQQARGIGADVQPRIDAAARGIEAGVNQRIGSLDKTLDRINLRDIPAIRSRARVQENELGRLWEWVHKNIAAVGTLTFAGAVAIALARLGGGWIRCKNWSRIGKSVCGLPLGLIEDLLAVAIDVLLISDICKLTQLMIDAAESKPIQDALRGIVGGVEELLKCQGVKLADPLSGYTAELPPAQPFALLPAA